jgi:hypothetical protein
MRAFLTVSFVVAAVALSASPVAAQGTHRSNPYSNLFTGQIPSSPQTASNADAPRRYQIPFVVASPQPSNRIPPVTVVCGLTIFQRDSKIDPSMPHHAERPGKASIKTIPAPMCQK